MLTRSLLAALAVATIALTAPAEARPTRADSARVQIDVAAIPAYPMADQLKAPRAASRAASQRVAHPGARRLVAEGRKASQRRSNGETVESRVERSSLVRGINAKLARWVRPTGKCGFGQTEQLATYYNSGRRTATGARFNPMGMTAAHRTMPFGTRLVVTNPHTGRSASIVINDRGPYTNAKIDLAQGAAWAIGMRTSIYVCVSGGTWASAAP